MSAGSSKYEAIDVITTIRQTIEVPKGSDKQEILNFLASDHSTPRDWAYKTKGRARIQAATRSQRCL